MPCRAPVAVEGPVEGWMTGVEGEMRRSLQVITKEGVWEYAQVRGSCLAAARGRGPGCKALPPRARGAGKAGPVRRAGRQQVGRGPSAGRIQQGACHRACPAPPQAPRDRWIRDCLGMVTLSGSCIWWAWQTEDAFRQVCVVGPMSDQGEAWRGGHRVAPGEGRKAGCAAAGPWGRQRHPDPPPPPHHDTCCHRWPPATSTR